MTLSRERCCCELVLRCVNADDLDKQRGPGPTLDGTNASATAYQLVVEAKTCTKIIKIIEPFGDAMIHTMPASYELPLLGS